MRMFNLPIDCLTRWWVLTTGTKRAYLYVSWDTPRDWSRHARHALVIRLPFVTLSIAGWTLCMRCHSLQWMLRIRFLFVGHSSYTLRIRFGREFERIWTLPILEKKKTQYAIHTLALNATLWRARLWCNWKSTILLPTMHHNLRVRKGLLRPLTFVLNYFKRTLIISA